MSFDINFGSAGIQTIHLNMGSFDDEGNSLLLMPDGSIVAGGDSNAAGTYDFIASKLLTDGSFDNSFGVNGIINIATSFNEYNTGVGFQPTKDRIILSGSNIETAAFFLAALKSGDGSLDTSFGAGGTKIIDVSWEEFGSGSNNNATSLAIDSSERIILSGFVLHSVELSDMAVVRLQPDGSLDSTFGGNGIVTMNFGSNQDESAMAVAIQSDGKIVLAGYANDDFAIVRLMPNGTLDTSFDGDGILIHHLGGVDKSYTVAIQANGKILAAGISDNAMAVTRYLSDGTLDATFGTAGVAKIIIGDSTIHTSSMKIQPSDGRIVLCGTCSASADLYEMYVIRLK